MLKLSLIIPVYNEERHMKACLDAVAAQTLMPDEVIVVDNNCTDDTISIAKRYAFVKVVTESKQGRAYARSTGFNHAKGDILGRIDADSRIDSGWVEHVVGKFASDQSLAGITGLGLTAVLPGVNFIKTKLMSKSYYWYVHAGFNTVTMWGANMAIRNTAWEKVKNDVILDDEMVHEDQDLSLWLAAEGYNIEQDNAMLITTNGQSYRYLPKMLRYGIMYRKTKLMHINNGNLQSSKLIKIGFFRSLPGRLASAIVGLSLLTLGLILFPVDLLMLKFFPRSSWLD